MRSCRVKRQAGAALLAAMLTVTLIATLSSTAIWQQYRSSEIEAAERARVQSGWLLTAALDWARLILREDARSGGADYLSEPWAIPLSEARLTSFLSTDKIVNENDRDAFLSGQITDLQSRLNVTNLINGKVLSEPDVASFSRLFELLGLPLTQLTLLTEEMLKVAAVTPNSPLMPQRVEQLSWFGLSAEVLKTLSPYITLLPVRTPVNINTASAEVISASTPNMALGSASKLVGLREADHFRSLAQAGEKMGGAAGQFSEGQHAVASRFFEVRGRLRVDQLSQEMYSVVQRDALNVRVLWRSRSVLTTPDAKAAALAAVTR